MRAIFRADASLEIGIGHVMRCLTLADALASAGASCEFICRAHPGNLIEFIRSKGYVTHSLSLTAEASNLAIDPTDASDLAHHNWLGASQDHDAQACATILAENPPDWLIVDHYAIDANWERMLTPHCRKLMVIDDLVDRHHVCNLLLDQTFGRDEHDYRSLVPDDCQLLCGSQYALLRPEFAALRPYSLKRRARPILKELLVTMGGVDKGNVTSLVLQTLRKCELPADCRITVAMGETAPWLEKVQSEAHNMPCTTRVLVNVNNMAQLMADSDLAIGAAGATTWERCCLGLPTAMLILAENQRQAAHLLENAGVARILHLGDDLLEGLNQFIRYITNTQPYSTQLSDSASKVTDGNGCKRTVRWLITMEKKCLEKSI